MSEREGQRSDTAAVFLNLWGFCSAVLSFLLPKSCQKLCWAKEKRLSFDGTGNPVGSADGLISCLRLRHAIRVPM